MTDKDFLFGGGGLGGRTKTWDAWSDDDKKAKVYKRHKRYKVYLTTLDDGRYYIGYSGLTGKKWDKYFGSGKVVKEYKGGKTKKVLFSYDRISDAKFKEMQLQIKYMKDPKCLNRQIRVNIQFKNLQDITK